MSFPAVHLPRETQEFYVRALEALNKAGAPYLVGGAYAFERHTGIARHTKDLDVFLREIDLNSTLEILRGLGFETDLTYPHWLAKAFCGEDFIDLIFSAGNGVSTVDDTWFDLAIDEKVLGVPVKLIPVEEMIWSKSFIMERERYDGADVAHLLRSCAEEIDWDRLIQRFGPYWRVLLTHLLLFGFIYPAERTRIPRRVMEQLLSRVQSELDNNDRRNLCQGTLLSRAQYLVDVALWNYQDGRQEPRGTMSREDIAHWTAAIDHQSRE